LSFLANDAINRVNLHVAVQALAQGAGGVFVFVFLLRSGVPAPLVLCTLAAMTLGRFVLRPLVLVFARRAGLRASLMLGAVLEAAIFPLLPLVHGPGAALAAVIAVWAFGSVFYWTSLHALFAALGDEEHRGHQVGARAAAAAAANIVAPWLGGWALVVLGPPFAFGLVALVQALSALPLLGAPNPPVAERAPPGWHPSLPAVLLQAGDGWFGAGFYYVWQIALFLALGERFASYGGAMALAGLAGAAASLAIGRFIDLGHGRRSLLVAYAACAAVLVLKAVSLGSPWLAVAANALATIAALLLEPVMMSPLYNLAKASPCPLRFHMATEGGWDLGCAGGCLSAAALTAAAIPLSASMLLALAGAAVGFALLWGRYAPAEAAAGADLTP
jgi:MFS transporter, DHA1 family, inner membrane transport protein